MRIKVNGNSFFFIILFAFAYLIRIQSDMEFAFVSDDIFYIGYIFILLILTLRSSNFGFNKSSLFAQLVLASFVYLFIFGVVFFNSYLGEDVIDYLLKEVLLFSFVFLTAYNVWKYKCLDAFIMCVYVCNCLVLLIGLIAYFDGFQYLTQLTEFWVGLDSYGAHYGFQARNIMGDLACSTIILSFYMFKRAVYSTGLTKKAVFDFSCIGKAVIVLLNVLFALMLVNSGSRGSILCLILFFLVFFLIKIFGRKQIKLYYKLFSIVLYISIFLFSMLLVYGGLNFYDLLEGTNRASNFQYNLQVLSNSERWLMGLGTVHAGFFYNNYFTANLVYGSRTSFCDCYYLYVFLTTGILGSIYMLIYYARIIQSIIKLSKKDVPFTGFIFPVIIYIIFKCLTETYIFCSTYIMGQIWTIFIFSIILIGYDKSDFSAEESITKSIQKNSLEV